MKDKNFDQQFQADGTTSNIIFGTSSDDIQRGLDNNQFTESGGGDEDQIVNEQTQLEVVNPSEETFNEDQVPITPQSDNMLDTEAPPATNELKENVIDLDVDKETIDKLGKVSKAED